MRDGGRATAEPGGAVGAMAALAAIITSRSPDTIVTFGPDGLTAIPITGVSKWTMAAVRARRIRRAVLHTAVTDDIMDENDDINSRFDVFEPGSPTLHRREDLSVDLTLGGEWLDRKLRRWSATPARPPV